MSNKYKVVKIIIIFWLLQSSSAYSQANSDSLFVKWNKITLSSLNRQFLEAESDTLKSFYQNRIDALKAFLQVKNVDSINSEAIRYSFLNGSFSKYDGKSKFYIVEANESGYITTIRDFVVYTDTLNQLTFDMYVYHRKWILYKKDAMQADVVDDNLKNYFTQIWKGENRDDVIITEFDNYRESIKSEYFLPYTLSKQCIFSDLIVKHY